MNIIVELFGRILTDWKKEFKKTKFTFGGLQIRRNIAISLTYGLILLASCNSQPQKIVLQGEAITGKLRPPGTSLAVQRG